LTAIYCHDLSVFATIPPKNSQISSSSYVQAQNSKVMLHCTHFTSSQVKKTVSKIVCKDKAWNAFWRIK